MNPPPPISNASPIISAKERPPTHAERLTLAIWLAPEILRQSPLIGRPGRVPGTRELVLTPLPWSLVYMATEDSIDIVRVLHGRAALAMNPGQCSGFSATRRRAPPSSSGMKKNRQWVTATVAAALLLAPAWAAARALVGQTAKQDMHKAGQNTKRAAKDTGRATKKTSKEAARSTKRDSKKAWHATKRDTKTAARKTKNTTKGAARGAQQGARQPAHPQ